MKFYYYVVEGTYTFNHYGEARHFARQIGANIEIRRTYNPLRIAAQLIDRIT